MEPSAVERDGTSDHFRFMRTTTGVILAVLVGGVALQLGTPREGPAITAEEVLMVILVFVFAELYIVLTDLHIDQRLPYGQEWLYMDLLIGVVYLWFFFSIFAAADCGGGDDLCAGLGAAMRLGVVTFAALLVRLLVGYQLLREQTGRLPSKVWRAVVLRSIADIGGIVLCVAIMVADPGGLLGLGTFGWSIVGLVVLLGYFFVRLVPGRLGWISDEDRPAP